MIKDKYTVLGVMSGSSLDGIDLALCEFFLDQNQWQYSIVSAKTIPYNNDMLDVITKCHKMQGFELLSFHNQYGKYIGNNINHFLSEQEKIPDLISSHGHTIFHQPDKGITFQIGNGSNIAAATKITTVSDFRSFDLALGGQGAPLVPIGDELLFGEFDYCLNIGGFANISFNRDNKRYAYDICPANIILNQYANQMNLHFDKNGELGKQGQINNEMLYELNILPYYSFSYPKSLGKEWVIKNIYPSVKKYNMRTEDILRTLYEHIAVKISDSLIHDTDKKVLVTGGGAFNSFLIKLIRSKSTSKIIIPDDQLVNYKEALIFAFLGVMKIRNQVNCLSSATGASQDNIGGIVYAFG